MEELSSKRPLIPRGLDLPKQQQEVLDTFRVATGMGTRALGAYVISMASKPSDVLAVVLLQKEARVQTALDHRYDHVSDFNLASNAKLCRCQLCRCPRS
jgi:phosphoenolpyruvate carboxylase